METVRVSASREYDVFIGTGFLSDVGEKIKEIKKPCRAVIVSDDTVYGIYGEKVKKSLEKSGFAPFEFVFPHGEESKSLKVFEEILNFCVGKSITRTDLIVALGGGVTGDLAGFAASAYLRGVDFVQIPTTLLAMVDSSVGGKTAVNLSSGKNLCGAFYQPLAVYADCETLETLPGEVFSEGCAEVIKYGMITDGGFLRFLENNSIAENIQKAVKRCIELKRDVVDRDEFEHGERKLLNFGHTIGHAVEKCSNLSVPHGDAVAIGMVIASKGAYRTGLSPEDFSELLLPLLMKNGLPVSCEYTAKQLYAAALSDKKRSLDSISLIVPEKYGRCKIENIPVSKLENFIERGLE